MSLPHPLGQKGIWTMKISTPPIGTSVVLRCNGCGREYVIYAGWVPVEIPCCPRCAGISWTAVDDSLGLLPPMQVRSDEKGRN